MEVQAEECADIGRTHSLHTHTDAGRQRKAAPPCRRIIQNTIAERKIRLKRTLIHRQVLVIRLCRDLPMEIRDKVEIRMEERDCRRARDDERLAKRIAVNIALLARAKSEVDRH